MQTSWRTSTTSSPACTMETSRAGSSSTSPEPDFAKVQFMSPLHIRPIARRRFVQGLALGGAVAGFAPALLARSAPVSPAELSGTERSEEHTSELQSLMRISYAVFCSKKKIHATVSHVSYPQLPSQHNPHH